MKTVRLLNNIVDETIPEKNKPISKWYNEMFAAQCVEAPDEVEQGWLYDHATNTFNPPAPPEREEEIVNGTVS